MKKSNTARAVKIPKGIPIKPKVTSKPPDMDIFEILGVEGKGPRLPDEDPVLMTFVPDLEPDPVTNILVPSGMKEPVPPSRLEKGMKDAKVEIARIMKEFSAFMNQHQEVKEMEFTVSFSADGKFMGFGVGGAFEVKLKVGAKK